MRLPPGGLDGKFGRHLVEPCDRCERYTHYHKTGNWSTKEHGVTVCDDCDRHYWHGLMDMAKLRAKEAGQW